MTQQTTNRILMVKPCSFYKNPQAVDNLFYGKPLAVEGFSSEWDNLRKTLQSKGIDVFSYYDDNQARPDSIFPNNWFSTHPGGRMCLYPMAMENRRTEKENALSDLEKLYPDLYNLEGHIKDNRFLEGTGSMVLDRKNKVAYAAASQRTDLKLFYQWCVELGYEPVYFHTNQNNPVYHTNVLMSIGENYSIVCSELLEDLQERERLISSLSAHRPLLDIPIEHAFNFCANVIELKSPSGDGLLVMSERSYNKYDHKQKGWLLDKVTEIVSCDLSTIENLGGGGARCMIAELF